MSFLSKTDAFYHTVNEKKKWAKARGYCRAHHTDLVSIRSPKENYETARLLNYGVSYWIGLYSKNLTTVGWQWQWTNGDAFNHMHWKDKKMNGNRTSGICVAINNGLWFPAYCNQTHLFICYEVLALKNKFVDREYYPIKQLKNWTEARDHCRSHYVDLVSIQSPEEAKYMSQLIVEDRTLWIGLFSKKGSTAAWKWTNGEAVNYTQWKYMEPNDYLNSESCVAVINEMNSPDRGYHLIYKKKRWFEARDYCRKHHIDLVSIRNPEEQKIFTSMFDRNIAFWIGLYNSNHSETGWKWLNGDKFNYTHWKEKEPNGYRGAMICVAVTNGMWFDDYCNQTYWFMCYKGKIGEHDVSMTSSSVLSC
uniref:C-type lectin domain-containing protein n=1 Tax=Callorhinchus milii TaxID=7868 RepID=A0A4W3IRB1_CALMI